MVTGTFYWLMTQSVATHVVGQISQHALLENFVANLRKSMRKVAVDSTFRERFCDLAHLVFGSCKLCNLQLVSLWHFKRSCMKIAKFSRTLLGFQL